MIILEVREWAYKTDETGNPRRFLGHREAAWWAVVKVVKVAGPILWPLVLGPFVAYFDPELRDIGATSVPIIVAVWLVLWFLASGFLYFYLVLSGGVMSREERQKHKLRSR